MKRKIFSVLLTLVLLLSFSLMTAVPVAAVDPAVLDKATIVTNAADRLVALQSDDVERPGWNRDITGLLLHDPDLVCACCGSTGSCPGIYGMTGLGLVAAYRMTLDEAYLTAAIKAASYPHILGNRITFDRRFLFELSEISEDPSYAESAIADWNVDLSGWTAQDCYDSFRGPWGPWVGAAFWETSDWALEAFLFGDEEWARDAIALMLADIADVIVADPTRFVGWGHLLRLLQTVDPVTYAADIADLVDKLEQGQHADGYWMGPNHRAQDTAYAIMGLASVDPQSPSARRGCAWLVANQGYDTIEGGWYDAEGEPYECPGYNSEAIQALVATAAPVTNDTKGYYSIQQAIDSAITDDIISVAAGTYDELLTIDVDGLTLLGVQFDEDPRPMSGGRSGAESIIQKTYTLTTDVLNPILIEASNVTINGFTISPHYEAGVGDPNGLNKDLIKQEKPIGDNWVGTTIKYNILTATGHNIVDNCDELVQLKGVTGAVIEYNYGYHEIAEESGGNAFNIADGSADSWIRYNEAYRCGDFQYAGKWGGAIYTYTSTNISVIGNKIVEGGGITFGASKATRVDQGWPSMRNFGGTVEGNIVENATFGLEIFADGATVSGNDVTGCSEYALNIIGSNITIQDNNLLNSETGILVEDKVENEVVKFSTTGVSINANNIYGNTFGLENLAAAEVDATDNYWGHASGPTHADNPFGIGDEVSGNVTYNPWLLVEVVPGVPLKTYDKTLALKDGWTLISVDKALLAGDPDRTWVGAEPLAEDPEETIMAFKYTPTGGFVPADPADLEPLTAIYVLTIGGGGVGFNYPADPDPAVYSKDLEAGWNLISIPSINADTRAILSPLRYVTIGTQQGVGLTTLVSQGDYNQFSPSFYYATLTDADWDALAAIPFYPVDGYWAYMEADDTFEVPVP